MRMSNPTVAVMQNAKAGLFNTGVYYKYLTNLEAGQASQFDNGTIFKYGYISNESKLMYYGGHVRIPVNSIVIETYSNLDLVQKSKIVLQEVDGTEKTLQLKDFKTFEIVVSKASRVYHHILVLG